MQSVRLLHTVRGNGQIRSAASVDIFGEWDDPDATLAEF